MASAQSENKYRMSAAIKYQRKYEKYHQWRGQIVNGENEIIMADNERNEISVIESNRSE
jgi:hypothetical protein